MILGFVMLLVGVSVAPYQIAQNGSTTATVTGSNMDGTVSVEVWNNDLSAKITSGVVVTPGEGSAASRKYEIKISADFELGDYKVVPTINGVRQTGVAGASLKVTDTPEPVGEYTVSGVVYSTNGDEITPIADAIVKLYNAEDKEVGQTKTDIDGKYVFNKVTNGNYYVTSEADGYLPGTVAVVVNGENVTADDIKLKPNSALYSIYGKITDAKSGSPLKATIKLFQHGVPHTLGDSIVADEEGFYSFSGLESGTEYRVVVTMSRYEDGQNEEYISITDEDVKCDIALTRAADWIPPQIEQYITDYLLIPKYFDRFTVIELWLKPEYAGRVSVVYGDSPFIPNPDNELHYRYVFDEITEINDDLVIIEETQQIILSAKASSTVLGTFAYIDLYTGVSLTYENISIEVENIAADRVSLYKYSSKAIPGKAVGDLINIKVIYDGTVIEQTTAQVK